MRFWLAILLTMACQGMTAGQGRLTGVRPIDTDASSAVAAGNQGPSQAISRIVGFREIPASKKIGDSTDTARSAGRAGRIVGVRELPSDSAPSSPTLADQSHPTPSRITGVRPILTADSGSRIERDGWANIPSRPQEFPAAQTKAPASNTQLDLRLASLPAADMTQAPPAGTLVPEPLPTPPEAQNILPKDAVAESLQELQATRTAASSVSSDWRITGGQSRLLPLIMAIQNSLTNKQVLHNLGSSVTVETTTLLDPDIAAQQITIAQSRFDPNIESFIGSNHIDLPPSSFSVSGLPVQTKRDEMELISRLTKEWASGARTSIGYEPSLAYLFFPLGNRNGYNPINSSDLLVTATQPLLRGAGPTVNLATIRITEDRQDQTRLNVDAKLQQQLRGIELAYWQLHASHVRRVAITEAIGLSDKMYEIEQSRFQAGRVIFADVARVGAKRENLIQQKLEAERAIQRLSLQIAQLAGMSLEATTMLVPSDSPEHRLKQYDLNTMVATAINRNPNLQLQRREIEIRDTELQVARNGLLPQLDLRSSVRSSGLNDDLGSALTDMARIEFVNLTMGMAFTRQIGNRTANSRYRQTQLEAARARQLLDAFEQNVAFNVAEALNSVELSYAKFESALRQLAQSQEWVKLANIRYENPPEELGQEALLVALMDYQYAIQARVDALVSTAEALADYNTKLVDVELQQGTLLERWGIALASNPNQAAETSQPSTR